MYILIITVWDSKVTYRSTEINQQQQQQQSCATPNVVQHQPLVYSLTKQASTRTGLQKRHKQRQQQQQQYTDPGLFAFTGRAQSLGVARVDGAF